MLSLFLFLSFLGAVIDGPASAFNQPKLLQDETASFMKLSAAGDVYVCAFRKTLHGEIQASLWKKS